MVTVFTTPRSFRRSTPKNREEEELVLGQSPRINFYPFSTRSIIPFPYDHVRLLKLSLKPSSWAHFLYQIYCIGPIGFGLIRLTIKNPPTVDPTSMYAITSTPLTILFYFFTFSNFIYSMIKFDFFFFFSQSRPFKSNYARSSTLGNHISIRTL